MHGLSGQYEHAVNMKRMNTYTSPFVAAGKRVEVKSATPKGSGPQGRGPGPGAMAGGLGGMGGRGFPGGRGLGYGMQAGYSGYGMGGKCVRACLRACAALRGTF